MVSADSFGARASLSVGDTDYQIFRLDAVSGADRLPFSLKVLLESLLRTEGEADVTADDVRALAGWAAASGNGTVDEDREVRFTPARVVMQDFTGVPAVVDLATMREAMRDLGGEPSRINPLSPAELVIDHSVIADVFGRPDAFERNVEFEYGRNRERYQFLRWGQTAFDDFRVVPPGTGIVHQVNIEYLARVVFTRDIDGRPTAYPDTLVGTDSHTTMVNGLGVLGWGVGGIEAEAAMLGQPVSMLIPQVVGFRLDGELPEGSTATDLVLTITQMLRKHGVVGKFVEFYGPGVAAVPVANRATIGNMSPEYGSTCAIFPIDEETLRYLRFTGRPADLVGLVEAYAKEQGLWHDPSRDPVFSETLELDLSTVVPSLAGPKRPQDRVALAEAKPAFRTALRDFVGANGSAGASRNAGAAGGTGAAGPASARAGAAGGGTGADQAAADSATVGEPGGAHARPASPAAVAAEYPYHLKSTVDEASDESFPASDPPAWGGDNGGGAPQVVLPDEDATERSHHVVQVTLDDGTKAEIDHGSVVIAAITSCTNTSNPSVMIGAALLAKKAVERGLTRRPWVKTSLAPGSKVVMDYYERAGLTPYLEKLGFHLVGYGCTTCIGNSGPLLDPVSEAVNEADLAVVSVLSGNRNFEGRINPDVKMNYLASPPLVVAYALAGTMDIDLTRDPLGTGSDGEPVLLHDLWPSSREVEDVITTAVASEMFSRDYADVFTGDERWQELPTPTGDTFDWDPDSTYVRKPPYFDGMTREPAPVTDVTGARVLARLGDSVTTDHISPAGSIKPDSPAGRYLVEHGVEKRDFNSYGSRRGNHEVMIRGTFANIRLRNRLPGPDGGALPEGGWTRNFLTGEQATIYDAAVAYAQAGVPLLVLAGKEYGSGSSRDWAAKGTALLGVRAVLAESYERIHRSNLIGMGVLPLQYAEGESAESLGLTGEETFDVVGIEAMNSGGVPREVTVRADGREFRAVVRIDTPGEAEYYRHGGIMQYVLRSLL